MKIDRKGGNQALLISPEFEGIKTQFCNQLNAHFRY